MAWAERTLASSLSTLAAGWLTTQIGPLATLYVLLAGTFMVVMFSSVGLPGLNGFVGEFLILVGSGPTLPWATGIAAFGVVLALTRKVFWGSIVLGLALPVGVILLLRILRVDIARRF